MTQQLRHPVKYRGLCTCKGIIREREGKIECTGCVAPKIFRRSENAIRNQK